MPKIRPLPNPQPPDINAPLEVLKKLLTLEIERLETAVKIERERKIVFPETSVIIHDIQRLTVAIKGKNKSQPDGGVDLAGLLEDLTNG